jgi:aquaporin Z
LIDAVYYVASQILGAIIGISIAGLLLGSLLRDPPTTWIVTQPGADGVVVALLAEFVVAFLVMETILVTGALPSLSRFTGAFVAILVFLFISFESPLSGFSMNPARSLGSAAVSGHWTAFWIYVLAPPLGMLTAVLLKRSLRWAPSSNCAKLVRSSSQRCIHCGFTPKPGGEQADPGPRCKARETSDLTRLRGYAATSSENL